MKTVTIILALLAVVTDPSKIGKINNVKENARKAYLAGDYKTAASLYQYLADSLNVQEDEVLLNLAHAHFQLNDTARAKAGYQQLTTSTVPSIRSTAQQQLGVLANRLGKPEQALTHFKEALKANPANDDARYNYELLKKKLDEQKKQEQQQQQNQQRNDQQQQDQKKQEKQDQKKDDKNQQKQDQQNSDQQKKDEQKQKEQQEDQQKPDEQQKDEKKETPSSVSEKLEQLKISEEKAKMLLEAMKNQEMQYLQQNKRKPTKPKDKGKPDW